MATAWYEASADAIPLPEGSVDVVLHEAFGRHVDSTAVRFLESVFALRDTAELERLPTDAGLVDVQVHDTTESRQLLPPAEFLWQYGTATPLVGVVSHVDERRRAGLQRDAVSGWEPFLDGGGMRMELRMVTVATNR